MSTSMPRAPLPQAPFAPPPHPGAAPAPGRGAGKRLAAARLSRGALDLVIALVVLAGAALVPLFAPTFLIPPLELVLVYVIALASLVVLVGYCGQISLCQVSFMGLGAFLTAAFMGHYGWSFWVAAPAACLVVFGAGVAVGLPALRLRGLTLAIVTLSLALVADNFLFTDIGWLNNDTYGWRLTPPQLFGFKLTDQDVRFRVFLAVTALVLLAVTRLRVGRTGKSWYAMRDAEIAAATSGVPI